MSNDFTSILGKFQSPTDISVILLAGTAGFVADSGLHIVSFLSPGYVGLVTAAGALGVKNAVQAVLVRRRRQPPPRQRALRLAEWMLDKGYDATDNGLRRLKRAISMHEAGIIDDPELSDSISETLDVLNRDPKAL